MTTTTENFFELFPARSKRVLSAKGREFVRDVGVETIRGVILDVLCGENIRESTESITRKKLAIANGGLFLMYLQGCNRDPAFVEKVIKWASRSLKEGKLKKEEGWILNWLLGLTDKAVQNILRDDPNRIDHYVSEFAEGIKETAREFESEFGELNCELNVGSLRNGKLNWEKLMFIMSAVGAQTLTIRGSEKSAYGKLFERLILGSLLQILGFTYVEKNKNTATEKVFWLSERADKRESDATLLFTLGKGVRFDIGFIGRGNPEISLDKVSRFERKMEYAQHEHYMATLVIVDRIGKKSRIESLAKEIDASIIQMSMSYWPKLVAKKLNEVVGYDSEILAIEDDDIRKYLQDKLKTIPIEDFLGDAK